MKMLLDFSAKAGREEIFKPTIGNESLHEISTMFQQHNIHKCSWMSPDEKTHNQIDHILIDR
jgi:hypothetical protein